MLTVLSGQNLIIAIVIWPTVVIVTCLILYYSLNLRYAMKYDNVRQVPTISQVGSLIPGSLILTAGLHIESFFFILFFLAVYLSQREKIHSLRVVPVIDAFSVVSSTHSHSSRIRNLLWRQSRLDDYSLEPSVISSLHGWNGFLVLLGIFCSIFMFLVGTITLKVSSMGHTAVAYMMFVCGVLHLIFFYLMIVPHVKPSERNLRICGLSFAMCVPFNIVMVTVAAVTSAACNQTVCQSVSENIYSLLEYTTALFLFVYVLSFYEDLQRVSLQQILVRGATMHADHTGLDGARYQSNASRSEIGGASATGIV